MRTRLKPSSSAWRLKATVLLTILTGWPLPSRATPEADPTPVVAGQPAPFAGILLPNEDAAALWKKIELLEGKLALEEKRCMELRAVDNNTCFQQLTVLRSTRDEQIQIWKQALARCELEKQRAWYESPTLLIGTGVVAGAALGIGVVWLGAQFRP